MQELHQMFPDAALRAQGYKDPQAVRNQILNRDRLGIVNLALKAGRDPARTYYELAKSRGFKSTRGINAAEARGMEYLFDNDPEKADAAWQMLADQGLLG
jgi:hypothetical protein